MELSETRLFLRANDVPGTGASVRFHLGSSPKSVIG